MRTSSLSKPVTGLVLLLFVSVSAASALAANPLRLRRMEAIEAVRGKEYALTKEHGPWMIMVTNIRDVPEERRISAGKGLTAREAADELVYELRRKGLPAYTYSTDEVFEQIETQNRRTGEKRQSRYVAQHNEIVVMAGNYKSYDDEKAQETLAIVKKMHPKVLADENSGGVFRSTPGRPGPLTRAFLAPNPLLSPEELKQSNHDPLIVKLNADMNHSMLKNPGRYSLVIASFHGKSMTQVGAGNFDKTEREFDSKIGESMDEAGMNAWRLCEALRSAKSLGYDQEFDSWVYHDRYKSVVSIGSFDDPRDPRIIRLQQFFAAKTKINPADGQQVLSAEIFTIPRKPAAGMNPEHYWIFDAQPELMEVPRYR